MSWLETDLGNGGPNDVTKRGMAAFFLRSWKRPFRGSEAVASLQDCEESDNEVEIGLEGDLERLRKAANALREASIGSVSEYHPGRARRCGFSSGKIN